MKVGGHIFELDGFREKRRVILCSDFDQVARVGKF